MAPPMRLRVSALIAALLFAVGYIGLALVPGGGDVTDQDFTNFYASDSKRVLALLSFFVLVAGCLAVIWFFTELRAHLPDGLLPRLGYAAAIVGAAAVMSGNAVLLGPAGVQLNSSHSGFVGVPVAHALAQAGLLLLIGVGMYSLWRRCSPVSHYDVAAVCQPGLQLRASSWRCCCWGHTSWYRGCSFRCGC